MSWFDCQMLCDNLELQEAIISNVKEKAGKIMKLFPDNDQDSGRQRLKDLEHRFRVVKERLETRKEEMLKSSVDWQEFELGLKSCLDWVEKAEEQLAEMLQLPNEQVDIGKLQVSNLFVLPLRICLFVYLSLTNVRSLHVTMPGICIL